MDLNPEIYKSLVGKLGYAVFSDLNDLVFEVYGRAAMAHDLGAISWDQFWKINAVAIRCWANGGADRKRKARDQFEATTW